MTAESSNGKSAIIVNDKSGIINLNASNGIGMMANGKSSQAINYGTINLSGQQVGSLIDGQGSIGHDNKGNYGMKAINGGKIINKGAITFKAN